MERVIVGISGASGAGRYGPRLLAALRLAGVESHLILSGAARVTLSHEEGVAPDTVEALADHVHAPTDMAAPVSSGSFPVRGMVVAPCSVRSMSEIASGVTSTLLARAADVTLKERRPLILMVRETPLHAGHLRTLLALSEMGAIIAPPVPAFYGHPTTLDQVVDHSVGRVLDLLGIANTLATRWGEPRQD